MALSVSIIKKYEDDVIVIYNYGDRNNENGEFSINKESLKVNILKNCTSPIDNIMRLSATAKIVKLLRNRVILPDKTSYNS